MLNDTHAVVVGNQVNKIVIIYKSAGSVVPPQKEKVKK
jgi:hypothetical protein